MLGGDCDKCSRSPGQYGRNSGEKSVLSVGKRLGWGLVPEEEQKAQRFFPIQAVLSLVSG